MKTRKALTNRFKVTKTGKLMRRAVGQNHYRSKKTGEQKRKGRKWIQLSPSESKKLKKFMSV
jgi:ribosomal protein L35